jgi:hypothetical protein
VVYWRSLLRNSCQYLKKIVVISRTWNILFIVFYVNQCFTTNWRVVDCMIHNLVFLFVFVLYALLCWFIWIVYFWLPLRYSLTFIYTRNFLCSDSVLFFVFVSTIVGGISELFTQCAIVCFCFYDCRWYFGTVHTVCYFLHFAGLSGLSIFDCPFGIL